MVADITFPDGVAIHGRSSAHRYADELEYFRNGGILNYVLRNLPRNALFCALTAQF